MALPQARGDRRLCPRLFLAIGPPGIIFWQDGREDTTLFEETDLGLGWMNIDIEQGGIELDVDNSNRMASTQQQRLICSLDSGGQHAAQHPATVHKERDILARAFIAGRAAH